MDWSMTFIVLIILSMVGLALAFHVWYVGLLIKIAKKMGIKKNLWFLYFPFLQEFTLCKMSKSDGFTFIMYLASAILSYFIFIPSIEIIAYLVGAIIYFLWSYRIVSHFKHSWIWALLFPFWVMSSPEKIFKEEEKPEKKISAKEIEKLESKDSENFFFMLKALGIIVGIVILLVVIRNIFF